MTGQGSRWANALPLAAAGVLAVVVVITAVVVMRQHEEAATGPPYDEQTQQEVAEAHEAVDFYIHSEQLAEARVILEGLLKRFPDDPQSHALTAKLLMAEGTFDAAYRHAKRSSELEPGDHETRFLTALLAEMNGAFDAAYGHYWAATELAPEAAGYAMYLGQSLMRLERFEEAERHLVRAQRLDATLSQTYSMRAEIAARRGEIEAAIAQVDTALAYVDRDSRHFVAYTLQKADLLRRDGKTEAAQAILHALPPRKQQEERVVEQLASGYLELDRPARAAAVWVELFAMEPDNARAAAEAGLAYLRAGQSEYAERYHDMARNLSTTEQTVVALEEALRSGN